TLLQLFQLDCQQSDSLINVVVQLPCDPGTLLFVGFNQPASDAGKGFLGDPSIGNVNPRTYVPGKRTVRVHSWHSDIEDPAVFSIVAPQAILHVERFSPIECMVVGLQARFQILGVNSFDPTISKLCLKRSACEIEPRLIEVVAQLIRTTHPNQYGRGV